MRSPQKTGDVKSEPTPMAGTILGAFLWPLAILLLAAGVLHQAWKTRDRARMLRCAPLRRNETCLQI